MNSYDDIISHPGWEPRYRNRMSARARAAQFAPFAALPGHKEALDHTGRDIQARIDTAGTSACEFPENMPADVKNKC